MYDIIKDSEQPFVIGEQATSSDAISLEDFYDTCYDAYYNAMEDFYNEHQLDFNNSFVSTYYSATPSEPLEYATSTDSMLYTVEVASAPTSSAQATEAYLLDTRNILIIFALTWLVVTLYSKIKNLMVNYMTKN